MTERSTTIDDPGSFWEHFLSSLPARVGELSSCARRGLDGTGGVLLSEAHRQAHGLAGSAATFGYPLIGEAARDLERLLKPMIQEDRYGATRSERQLIEAALDALTRVATAVAARHDRPPDFSTRALETGKVRSSETVYVLDDDSDLTHDWAIQLRRHGYVAREFNNISTMELALKTECPVAIVADEHLPDGRTSEFLSRRRASGLAVPAILSVSNDSGFETRLAAVRAGAKEFFAKPLDLIAVADRLAMLTHPEQRDAPRILMVEDVQAVADFHASLLRNAGMQVDVVSDPLTLMQYLGADVPDLILMDMYMPGCNGIELATVLRQQDMYAGIPIVFLSGEEDLSMQMQALEIGGDDFLTKPVNPQRLVAVVLARVKRARTVRGLMTHDSLTGLLNHTTVKEALEREVSQARRLNSALSLAVIDVDRFKMVNDQHGHQAGDRVLKTLARLLKKRLRRSDVIGRYGGEEFVVALPNTGIDAASEVLEGLRSAFAGIEYQTATAVFRVTFSAGLAGIRESCNTATSLIGAADLALYEAKAQGRNRLVRSG